MNSTVSAVEILESRIAPATIVVTTVNDTIGVAGSTSLRDAIALANNQTTHPGPDTIVFKAGVAGTMKLLHGEFLITDTLNIKGPGANKLIIDAGGTSRIFDIDDGDPSNDHPASISGLALIGGKVTGTTLKSGDGGAIFSYESLSLAKDVIAGNSAHGSGFALGGGGGGVFVSAYANGAVLTGTVSIKNCIISGNTCTNGNAGGVYASAKKSLQITGSALLGNSATNGIGGGGFLETGSSGTGLVASHDIATGNKAELSGGGLDFSNQNSGSATTISACTFTDNAETNSGGGGMQIQGTNDVISGCVFRGNTAGTGGGGLALFSVGSLKMTGSKATGNHATAGGGLYLFGAGNQTGDIAAISKSQFSHNSATGKGGGVYATHGIDFTLSGCSIDGNSAVKDGGGIATMGTGSSLADLKIVSGEVSGNSTPSGGSAYGGGVFMHGDGDLTITGTKINDNSDGFLGGGVYADNTGAVRLTNVIAHGNSAISGGALFLDSIGANATFLIKGGAFTENYSLFYGGAFTLGGSGIGSTGKIVGAKITGNIAGLSGGGIYNTDANASLAPSAVVTGNIALSNPNTFGF